MGTRAYQLHFELILQAGISRRTAAFMRLRMRVSAARKQFEQSREGRVSRLERRVAMQKQELAVTVGKEHPGE